ncbi:MAG: hypothetical protein PWP67_1595 [Clostridium butyricum]|jgi:hypothetical protein|nr:hypothetical protein [Clostridium butyricum]
MNELNNKHYECIYEIICVNQHEMPNVNVDKLYIEDQILDYLKEKINYILFIGNEKTEIVTKKLGISNGNEDINKNLKVLDKIVRILFSRDFNYQSMKSIKHHINRVNNIITRHIVNCEPIPLYIDLGGGYHASTDIEHEGSISFDINIGEVLLLYQIKKLYNRIKMIYSPAIKFTIVIDNIVANFVNDISIDKTLSYCNKLMELIKILGMDDIVNMLIESEHCNWIFEYKKNEYKKKDLVGFKEYLNVMRFLGRNCSLEEAVDRISRYEFAIRISDNKLNLLIGDEIRFVQRSNSGQLTFRSFPGGAARIQCGSVGFRVNERNKIVPILITYESREKYCCKQVYIDLMDLIYELKNNYIKQHMTVSL